MMKQSPSLVFYHMARGLSLQTTGIYRESIQTLTDQGSDEMYGMDMKADTHMKSMS